MTILTWTIRLTILSDVFEQLNESNIEMQEKKSDND
jgi:hypothetical protein